MKTHAEDIGDGLNGVSYAEMTDVAAEAIREQQKMIDELQKRGAGEKVRRLAVAVCSGRSIPVIKSVLPGTCAACR